MKSWLSPPPDPLHALSVPYPAHAGLPDVKPPLHVGVVPPTPMTWGELAGLSTVMVDGLPLPQSRLPLSPDAANHDCPIAFALAKMLSSVCCVPVGSRYSQAPQLVDTT